MTIPPIKIDVRPGDHRPDPLRISAQPAQEFEVSSNPKLPVSNIPPQLAALGIGGRWPSRFTSPHAQGSLHWPSPAGFCRRHHGLSRRSGHRPFVGSPRHLVCYPPTLPVLLVRLGVALLPRFPPSPTPSPYSPHPSPFRASPSPDASRQPSQSAGWRLLRLARLGRGSPLLSTAAKPHFCGKTPLSETPNRRVHSTSGFPGGRGRHKHPRLPSPPDSAAAVVCPQPPARPPRSAVRRAPAAAALVRSVLPPAIPIALVLRSLPLRSHSLRAPLNFKLRSRLAPFVPCSSNPRSASFLSRHTLPPLHPNLPKSG